LPTLVGAAAAPLGGEAPVAGAEAAVDESFGAGVVNGRELTEAPEPESAGDFGLDAGGLAEAPEPASGEEFELDAAGLEEALEPASGEDFELDAAGLAEAPEPALGEDFELDAAGLAEALEPASGEDFELDAAGLEEAPEPASGGDFELEAEGLAEAGGLAVLPESASLTEVLSELVASFEVTPSCSRTEPPVQLLRRSIVLLYCAGSMPGSGGAPPGGGPASGEPAGPAEAAAGPAEAAGAGEAVGPEGEGLLEAGVPRAALEPLGPIKAASVAAFNVVPPPLAAPAPEVLPPAESEAPPDLAEPLGAADEPATYDRALEALGDDAGAADGELGTLRAVGPEAPEPLVKPELPSNAARSDGESVG
jgi:hypothetical protein